MNHLVSQTKPVYLCTDEELRRFYQILSFGFLGVAWSEFLEDIREKDNVMILRKDCYDGQIVGFSTLMVFDLNVGLETVKVVFSGDTYVLPEFRSGIGLGVELGRNFMSALERFPSQKVYYILISKGWRTYRILPFSFREFFPNFRQLTPVFEKAVMDSFGRKKYPCHYNSSTGIIAFNGDVQRLKQDGVDAFPQNGHDPHIKFFMEKNPGYLRGEEVVCVARVDNDNFTRTSSRYLRAGRSNL